MTLVFSLVGGLLVAIALQLVFANLGIALGLTVLDWSPRKKAQESPQPTKTEAIDNETSGSKQSLPITHFLGFGVAIGFSAAIFLATLLSVEFSQIFEPRRGIIFGLIVWATYWLLFSWLSSTTISGIADSILGSALQGGKQLLTTVKKTAQQTAKDLGRHNGAATNEGDTSKEVTLQDLKAEVSQLADIQKTLPAILAHQREALLAELADSDIHTAKSAHNNNSGVNNSGVDNSGADLKVETVIDSSSSRPSVATAVSTPSSSLLSQLDLPSWQQILRRTLTQVDLSDWDVETILKQLPIENPAVTYAQSQISPSATAVLPESQASEDAEKNTRRLPKETISSEAENTAVRAIQAKLISYCRYTNTDLLTPENLNAKVQAQREEYGLSKASTHRNAQPLDIAAIEAVLDRRNKLSTQQKHKLVETLQRAWPIASTEASDAEESVDLSDEPTLSVSSVTEKAYKTLAHHFQSVDWAEVSLEDIKPDISSLLERMERKGASALIDWQTLSSRIQIPENTKAELVTWLQTAGANTWSQKVQSLRPAVVEHTQDLPHQLTEKITHLLHHQQKAELTPAHMAKSLTQVVGSAILHSKDAVIATLPQSSAPANPSEEVSRLWDKTAWQQALEKRKDLTQAEIEQILDWGETVWQPKAQQLGSWLQAIRTEARDRVCLPTADILAEPIANAAHQAIDQMAQTKENIVEQADEVKESIVEQIEEVKESIVERVDDMKVDIQRQADAARGQIAIAAWWLFIALVSSGSAAAGAGYLAATY